MNALAWQCIFVIWMLGPSVRNLDEQSRVQSNDSGASVIMRPVRTLIGHRGAVTSIRFCGKQRMFVSGGEDGSVRIWQHDRRKALAILRRPSNDAVTAIAYSKSSGLVAAASSDRCVHVWSLSNRLSTTSIDSGLAVSAVALSPNGRLLAVASRIGRRIKVYDLCTCRERLNINVDVTSVVFDRGGTALIAAGKAKIRSLRNCDGKLLGSIKRVNSIYAPPPIAISKNGTRLIDAGNTTVVVWDRKTHTKLITWQHDGIEEIRDVAVSKCGRTVAVVDGERLHVWDSKSGRARAKFLANDGSNLSPNCVALSADNRFVATGNLDGTITIWITTSD